MKVYIHIITYSECSRTKKFPESYHENMPFFPTMSNHHFYIATEATGTYTKQKLNGCFETRHCIPVCQHIGQSAAAANMYRRDMTSGPAFLKHL